MPKIWCLRRLHMLEPALEQIDLPTDKPGGLYLTGMHETILSSGRSEEFAGRKYLDEALNQRIKALETLRGENLGRMMDMMQEPSASYGSKPTGFTDEEREIASQMAYYVIKGD